MGEIDEKRLAELIRNNPEIRDAIIDAIVAEREKFLRKLFEEYRKDLERRRVAKKREKHGTQSQPRD